LSERSGVVAVAPHAELVRLTLTHDACAGWLGRRRNGRRRQSHGCEHQG
jgi:hypothetical protein